MKFRRAGFCEKPDLHGPLAAAFSPWYGGGHSDLLHSVRLWLDLGKKAVGTAQEVILDVHSIEREIDRALWQAVDGRGARHPRSLYAG